MLGIFFRLGWDQRKGQNHHFQKRKKSFPRYFPEVLVNAQETGAWPRTSSVTKILKKKKRKRGINWIFRNTEKAKKHYFEKKIIPIYFSQELVYAEESFSTNTRKIEIQLNFGNQNLAETRMAEKKKIYLKKCIWYPWTTPPPSRYKHAYNTLSMLGGT